MPFFNSLIGTKNAKNHDTQRGEFDEKVFGEKVSQCQNKSEKPNCLGLVTKEALKAMVPKGVTL